MTRTDWRIAHQETRRRTPTAAGGNAGTGSDEEQREGDCDHSKGSLHSCSLPSTLTLKPGSRYRWVEELPRRPSSRLSGRALLKP
jgi:hypothetical protein